MHHISAIKNIMESSHDLENKGMALLSNMWIRRCTLSKRFLLALALLSTYTATLSNAYAARYELRKLGTFGLEEASVAWDINNDGHVIGDWGTTSESRPFLWTEPIGLQDLSALDNVDYRSAKGINNRGEIVGARRDSSGFSIAVLRDADGLVRDLSNPSDEVDAMALSINDSGKVLGAWGEYAVMWNVEDGSRLILGGGDAYSCISDGGINDDNKAVWSQEITVTQNGETLRLSRAFIWDIENGARQLPLLVGTNTSHVYDINEQGQAVGYSGGHAILWNPDGTVVDLGLGVAYGINNPGVICGQIDSRAVLWDTDFNITRLPVFPGSDFSLACGINDLGLIAGGAMLSGYWGPRAVIWEPVPEPSSLFSLASLLLPVALSRRKRKWTEDCRVFDPEYDDTYDTVPDKSFTCFGI